MRRDQIRSFIQEHGVQGFSQALDEMLEGRKLPNGTVQRLEPTSISIAALYEAMVGPVFGATSLTRQLANLYEAGDLGASMFPTITEKLIASVMIRGYNSRPGIADTLVPDSYSPKTLTERIPGFTALSSSKQVLPGEPYPTGDFSDKYATFEQAVYNKKEGYQVNVLEETIRFDQTGMIMRQAEQAGNNIMQERERRSVRAILGIGLDTGTAYNNVYFPSNTDSPLYSATQKNLRTNATPIYNHPGKTADSKLEDYTDFAEVLTTHAQNITDDRQLGNARPIAFTPNRVLTPVSLIPILANIFNSTTVTFISTERTAGTNPEIRNSAPNPTPNIFQALGQSGMPVPLSSPYVDEVTQTAWIVYDTNTFLRVNLFPFQTFRSPAGYGWERDLLMAVRAREWSRVIATDYRGSIRNDGA